MNQRPDCDGGNSARHPCLAEVRISVKDGFRRPKGSARAGAFGRLVRVRHSPSPSGFVIVILRKSGSDSSLGRSTLIFQ